MSYKQNTYGLSYFREVPETINNIPPLLSALQSFETSLFLLSLGRYPSALVAVGTCWEGVMKAKLGISPDENDWSVYRLWRALKQNGYAKRINEDKFEEFRKARNKYVHYGFIPKDDDRCSELLLKSGYPILSILLADLFDFYLDWKDACPNASKFDSTEIDIDVAKKIGLVPWLADWMRVGVSIYSKTSDRSTTEFSYCLRPLVYYVRSSISNHFQSSIEAVALSKSDKNGILHDSKIEELKTLEKHFGGLTQILGCPICSGIQTVVACLDERKIDHGNLEIIKSVCVECGFFIREEDRFLSKLVMGDKLQEVRESLLRDLGINE